MAPPRRVLIVDDQDILVTSITALLDTSEEIEVVGSAWNGEEALKVMDDLAPDVVLMDIDMPVMDGVEATRHLVERYPEVNILILTGLYAPERVDLAMRAGASSYLPKDLIATHLITAIVSIGDSEPLGRAS
jgi:DNA-binding NarL/FixJ family response regulator